MRNALSAEKPHVRFLLPSGRWGSQRGQWRGARELVVRELDSKGPAGGNLARQVVDTTHTGLARVYALP